MVSIPYEFLKLAIDELNAFDYEEFNKKETEVKRLGDYPLDLMDKPDDVKKLGLESEVEMEEFFNSDEKESRVQDSFSFNREINIL